MKLEEAMNDIKNKSGYRVEFELKKNGMLYSDHFPDNDEPALNDEDYAWRLAEAFAIVRKADVVNVYVINAFDFAPVAGYEERKLNKYP
jgi:hypothetical protein